jgi:hypothetical protein
MVGIQRHLRSACSTSHPRLTLHRRVARSQGLREAPNEELSLRIVVRSRPVLRLLSLVTKELAPVVVTGLCD